MLSLTTKNRQLGIPGTDEAKRILYKKLLATTPVSIGQDKVHRLIFNVMPTSSQGIFSLIESDTQTVHPDCVVVWIKQNPHPERVAVPRILVSFLNPPEVIRKVTGPVSRMFSNRTQTVGTVTLTQSILGIELVLSVLPLLLCGLSEPGSGDTCEQPSAT